MSELKKIKIIAEQMPESREKREALQAYSNLKTFEIVADSFDKLINRITGEREEQ